MMRVRRGLSRAVIVAAIALAGMFLGSCQVPGSVLRGRVTTAAGSHVAGIPVEVYSNSSEETVASTLTDSSGDYSFMSDSLAPGTYRVRFGTNTWWNGASEWSGATSIAVSADSATVIDATVDIATGSVAGTVTDGNGPVSGVAVVAQSSPGLSKVAKTTTATDGTYSFAGLPSGNYVFAFSKAGYGTLYNGSATSSATATVVSVTDGAVVTGIDTSLMTQGTVTGRVTDGTSGLSGIAVVAYDPATWNMVSFAVTTSDGTYSVGSLASQPYVIGFFDPTGQFGTLIYGSPYSLPTPQFGTYVYPVGGTTIDLGTIALVANTVPDAPTRVAATPGGNQATVAWAPVDNGGSAITHYTATASTGQSCVTSGALTCTVTGLTNGTSVTFTVTATNAVGTSATSAASTAIVVGSPTQPIDVTATVGDSQATVSWTAPGSDGGSAISGYTVTASTGQTCAATDATTCVVTGLTNGTPVTFTVTATNANGTGAASAASAEVTPHVPVFDWRNQSAVVVEPPARFDASMAAGPDGTVVLFGGGTVGSNLGDTWVWDGTDWTQKTPTISPPARYGAAMAQGPDGNDVLFGGSDFSGNKLGDTWVWNGTEWTQMTPASSPPPLFGASMAPGPDGTIVLFGGLDTSGNDVSETWVWDGTDWTQKNPTDSPPARYLASMAAGPDGTVVLFGGAFGIKSDTWVWDGVNWTQKTPATSAPGLFNASMTQAPDGSVVLFGGASPYSDETWIWDGVTWTKQNPGTSPSARVGASMAAGPDGSVVLFGGTVGSGLLSDTWVWSLE